jgi:hypothetical protein
VGRLCHFQKMDIFVHVRMVISILVGFSLTRLVSAAPELAQQERKQVYWIHLVWCLFMFLYVIAFWWWQFQLITVPRWTFPHYVFVVVYGVLVYFLCGLLSPTDLSHYEGYKEYLFSRRKWFFGAMAVMFVADLYDDYLKGPEFFHGLGHISDFGIGFLILFSLLAIKVRNELFHAAFAVFALGFEVEENLRLAFTLA